MNCLLTFLNVYHWNEKLLFGGSPKRIDSILVLLSFIIIIIISLSLSLSLSRRGGMINVRNEKRWLRIERLRGKKR